MKTKRIAIFASGSGSNAENIARYFAGNSAVKVACFISNKKDAYVFERARKSGIPSYYFSAGQFKNTSDVVDFLKKENIDFIVLAGFLLKIPENILQAFPQAIINIHPALLPEFGGKGMYGDRVHEAVLAAGRKQSGITIHYVNENYDEGEIIFQAACNISPNDTASDVAAKVHTLEYEYFPKIIEKTLNLLF
ncbi:MAG: phosphoribosylglycinamide formyltransferase [Bacteroidales bacterium]|jgi:phosphoribosylglycinamide formyltransferase-1|nr:phosphoribosylglycinamide formyltransferase [Bacteroidales bacterium]